MYVKLGSNSPTGGTDMTELPNGNGYTTGGQSCAFLAAATVAGVVGGAMVGNNIEKNRNQQGQNMVQIQVRMNNGDIINMVQESAGDLHVGNRVRVLDGRVLRY